MGSLPRAGIALTITTATGLHALADRARADALQLFTPSVVGEEDQGLV